MDEDGSFLIHNKTKKNLFRLYKPNPIQTKYP